ncbi:UPF0193 protein EVG1 [Pholidichthys leucotaenia]
MMKQESRLTNLERKQNNKCPKTFLSGSSSVPPTSDPSPSSHQSKLMPKYPSTHTRRRSAESCRSGNGYQREKFHPGPTRDLEKEKRRLQNILAGEEELTVASSHKAQKSPMCRNPEVSEIDRFQEVLNEIEERQQFLADMASLGQEKQYINTINTEISQKIRELEMLEKTGRIKDSKVE